MDFLNEFLPIVIYILLVVLIILLIILAYRLIKTMDKVKLIVDSVDEKVSSLNGVFAVIDRFSNGFSRTRRGARQIVNHGHILVNGKKVDIPSYMVKPGDVISVKESSKDHKAIKEALEAINNTVEFVTFDKNKLEGTYVRLPERSELSSDINEALIVEFYSR